MRHQLLAPAQLEDAVALASPGIAGLGKDVDEAIAAVVDAEAVGWQRAPCTQPAFALPQPQARAPPTVFGMRTYVLKCTAMTTLTSILLGYDIGIWGACKAHPHPRSSALQTAPSLHPPAD